MAAPRRSLEKAFNVPGTVARRIERAIGGRYYQRHFHHHPEHPALDETGILDDLSEASRLTFLCLGNICRSPFAARYTRRQLPPRADLHIDSAGLSPYEGIRSPPEAIETAETFGVDLRDHRSSRATPETLARSDLVFVMDFRNYYLLATRHAKARGKTRFLGSLLGEDPQLTIPDPHGSDAETFRTTYTAIATAIDRLCERT